MKMSNRFYDRSKFLALVAFPALAVFYGVLGGIWGLPLVDEVTGSIVAVDTLLGALLQISTKSYQNEESNHDGTITATGINEDTGHPDLQLTLSKLPTDLLAKKVVTLKVNPSTPDGLS